MSKGQPHTPGLPHYTHLIGLHAVRIVGRKDVFVALDRATTQAEQSTRKAIQGIGLFMQNEIVRDSDVFPTRRVNDQFSFVYITQSLTRVERGHLGDFPMEAGLLEVTDEIFHFTPEVMYLARLHQFGANHPVQEVRMKYKATLTLFKKQYPRTLRFMEAHDFRWEDCSPLANWDKALAQWPQNFRWAIKERKKY